MSIHEGESLRLQLRAKKINQEEFASGLGIGRSTLLNYMKLSILPDDIKQMLRQKGITFEEHINTVDEPSVDYKSSLGSTILHVPAEAEAGFIGGQMTPVLNYDLQQWTLPGFDEPGYSFRVRGESMFPTFKDGEFIVTGTRQEPFELIRKDFVYVIVTPDNILVKRINRQPDGKLHLVSDNPDFGPITVEYDNVKVYRARRNVSYDLSKKYTR